MRNRELWLSLLVCLNLLLLTGIMLAGYSLPTAVAQGTGLGDSYMVVSGEIQDEYDALYIIDVRNRTIHVFHWDRGKRDLIYTDWRALDIDFRNNRG